MTGDPDGDNNKVGYGRPPRHSRWRKGQSGNPSGRPRSRESIRAKLLKLIGEEIVARSNGKETVMTQEEAMLRAAAAKAMKGDLRALKLIVEMVGADSDGGGAPAQFELSHADFEALQTRADWAEVQARAQAEIDGAQEWAAEPREADGDAPDPSG